MADRGEGREQNRAQYGHARRGRSDDRCLARGDGHDLLPRHAERKQGRVLLRAQDPLSHKRLRDEEEERRGPEPCDEHQHARLEANRLLGSCPVAVLRAESRIVGTGETPDGALERRHVRGSVLQAHVHAFYEGAEPSTTVMAVERGRYRQNAGRAVRSGARDHAHDPDTSKRARMCCCGIGVQPVGCARPAPERSVADQPELHGLAERVAEAIEGHGVDECLVGPAASRRSPLQELQPVELRPASFVQPGRDCHAATAVGENGLAGARSEDRCQLCEPS